MSDILLRNSIFKEVNIPVEVFLLKKISLYKHFVDWQEIWNNNSNNIVSITNLS